MPERPTIFTSKDDFVRGNEERQSIFGRGTVRQGLPPASREEIRADKASRIGPVDAATGQAIDAIFSQVEPQQGSYINSQEFRQMFLKFAYGSEDLSDEEKRQISIAMDLYPPLRQVAQTIANTPRPEATIGAITNEQAEEGLRSYEKMMAENISGLQEATTRPGSGGSLQSKVILPLLIKGLRTLQEFTDKGMASISSRDSQGRIPLEVQFEEVMRDIGLEATDPDDAFFEFENPRTGLIDKVPMTNAQIIARNLLKGVMRLPGDIIIGHIRDPIGFYLALPDFAFGEVDLVVQAALGQDIIFDEETGEVAFRAISEEEQEQANKDFMKNPHAPLMALAMFAGISLKGTKSGKFLAEKRIAEALSRRAKKVEGDLLSTIRKLDEAILAKFAAERRAAEKVEREPLILDESLGETAAENIKRTLVESIEAASDGALRGELLAMQEGAVSKFSAVEIAKMPIEEVKGRLSNGEIGTIPTEPAPAGKAGDGQPAGTLRAQTTLPDPNTSKVQLIKLLVEKGHKRGDIRKMSREALYRLLTGKKPPPPGGFGETSDLVLEVGDVRPSGEAGPTSTEAVARLKSQEVAGDKVYRLNIKSGKIEELPATVDRVDLQPGENEVIATVRDGKVIAIHRNSGIKLLSEELRKKVTDRLPKPTVEKAPALTEPEGVAQALGVKYDGKMERKDGTSFHLFTDPKTGTTIPIDNLANLPKAVQASRVKFAEAKLQKDKAKAEADRLEAEQRERELATVEKETDPEIQRLKLEVAQIQDKILEQEKVQEQFREALPFADKASKQNIEAAIKSIDEAILSRKIDIGKKVDELTEARRKAEAPVEEAEVKAADKKVDETTEKESEVIAEDGSTKNKEEQKDKTDKRVKAVEERKEAEKKAEELSEEREADIDKMVDETQEITKSTTDIPPVTGFFRGKKQFEMRKIDEMEIDTTRFQDRIEEYSEESVQKILDHVEAGRFDKDNFDPIHIWLDPKDGKMYVLAGHSRLEALKRLGVEEAPFIIREFKTEKEAIVYATEISNEAATAPDMASRIRRFKKQRERGDSLESLKAVYGKDLNFFEALRFLDPGGKVLDIVTQGVFKDFPNAEKFARKIGELRKQFPELTNTHEKQIWDQLYPTDKATGLHDKIGVNELEDIVNKQTSDAFWTPEMPIKLRYDPKPMTGTRARKDTGPLENKIAELEALKNQILALDKPSAEQIKSIEQEIRKVKEAIGVLLKTQLGLELGSGFGTPQAYVDLWIMVDKFTRKTGGMIGAILEHSKRAEELKPGFEGAIESMKQHHRNLNSAKFYEQVMAHQFEQLVPNKARRQLIVDMLQIEQPQAYANYLKKEKGIIIDPADFSKDKLTPLEQGVLEWLKKERDQVEKFKIDNDLVTPRKLPPGVKYAFQWWMNPETGKAYGIEYGRYTKSLPQSKERTFNTYLEGRLAGKEMATDNVGFLIGKDFEMAMRAHAGRELYKTLHQLELGTGQAISMSPEIAHGMIPGDAAVRPAMFMENWLTIKESALAEEYVRVDVPYLEKPVSFTVKMEGVDFNYPLFPEYSKKIRNKKITLQGPVAVHESIAPWVKAYFDKPNYNTLTKMMMFAKSMKLAGVFHASQLVITDFVILGRNPIKDIIRARKLKYNLDDPSLKLLVEEGLRIEGFDDLGWDPVEALRWEGKGPTHKFVNQLVLGPVRGLAKFTFHFVGNNLKVALAYDVFLKQLPKWEKKVGPDMTMEQARRQAAREAVKFADRMFSHEDFRMAMLESSKAMVNFYYSTTARTTLHSLLISPQWQKQHIVAFAEGVKGLNPVQIMKDIKNGTESPSSNLYRRYMAGIATSFAIMDAYNYAMTQYMDGEGKHFFENPEGHGFHVRAPFDNPDGTTAWIRPFKTAFEIPEAMVALWEVAKNLGQSIVGEDVDFDAAKLSKFTNKMNPWFASFFANFKFNVDTFGNRIYEKRGVAEKVKDFFVDVYEPISLSQFAELSERHKAPMGAVLSFFGFPVSKGYPGGPMNKQLKEFFLDIKLEEFEMKDIVSDKIIAAMNGDEGQLAEALLIMTTQLRMGPKARSNFLKKHWNPLISSYDNLGTGDRAMWYLHLQETGQLEDFLDAIDKDAGN